MTDSGRIKFIDLAKGLCILCVVAFHCDIGTAIPGGALVRMPLFTALSGLFFKDYGKESITRKTNKLLIPYITFYILGDLFYYAIYKAGMFPTFTKDYPIIDIITGGTSCNMPTWFLLCLFNCYIIFLIITRISKSYIQTAIYSAIAGAIGVAFHCLKPTTSVFFINSALSLLPFYCFGYMLRRTSLLSSNSKRQTGILSACVLYAVSLWLINQFPDSKLNAHDNTFYGNIAMTYVISLLLVTSVLLACRSIRYLPFVSFLGRYSIIILVIHLPVMEILYYAERITLGHENNTLTFILTIVIASILIFPIKKYMPHVTAQKDLIPHKGTKQLISILK